MMPLGIVFGAAHAMTPGHSKSILATYVLGSGLDPLRAVLTSLILAATHITSAVLLAVIANTLVTRTLVGAGRAPALENISRYMLVAIGVWLVCRAWRSQPHIHGEGYLAGFVAGLVPCPLTLFVMTLAVSRGVPEAGLAFAVAMFLGVACRSRHHRRRRSRLRETGRRTGSDGTAHASLWPADGSTHSPAWRSSASRFWSFPG